MKRVIVVLAVAASLVGGVFAHGAAAKSIGGCPTGDSWQLVTVESLGIPEEEAVGIASLDGNRDGWTCITPNPANAAAPISGASIFRDNTVG